MKANDRPNGPGRKPGLAAAAIMGLAGGLLAAAGAAHASEPAFPISADQRATAQQVAQGGVALSELAPNAPESHTVQKGDTLWAISGLFLKSPWRWPELWGMNLDQIRNPHLIYPGQMLFLDKSGGRARLRVGQPVGSEPPGNTVKLSPRVREQLLEGGAIASVPMNLIGPFLNEAVVFNAGEMDVAPRIVATQEGRVIVSRGETAYVRGDLRGATDFRLFREPRPLLDPDTREVLGYEGVYVGTARLVRQGQARPGIEASPAEVPATFTITSTRLDSSVGDRLAPVPQSDLAAFAPRAPNKPVTGRIVSVYGEALIAGQNQIVALNRGAKDGLERGHVLALWRAGSAAVDRTVQPPQPLQLPDERHGLLFVFRVFERVSYALILQVQEPVRAGDHFSQP